MNNLYQIMITCIHSNDYYNNNYNKMKQFIEQNDDEFKDIGLINTEFVHYTFRYGEYKERLSIKTNIECSDDNDIQIIELAKELKEEMINYGIIGEYRIKIDLMGNNIPISVNYQLNICGIPNYYEFSWQIKDMHDIKNLENIDDYMKLEKDSIEFGIHLFINKSLTELKKYPTATLRYFNVDHKEAIISKDFVIAILKSRGWIPVDTVESKYSYYDDNYMLDDKWLFDHKITNIITNVPQNIINF